MTDVAVRIGTGTPDAYRSRICYNEVVTPLTLRPHFRHHAFGLSNWCLIRDVDRRTEAHGFDTLDEAVEWATDNGYHVGEVLA